MTDHLTPDDPIDAELAARIHATADGIDGTGVTRARVDAAVAQRRRRTAWSRGVLGVAAAVLVIVGLAVAGSIGGDGDTQRISSAAPSTSAPTTTAPLPPCPPTSTTVATSTTTSTTSTSIPASTSTVVAPVAPPGTGSSFGEPCRPRAGR